MKNRVIGLLLAALFISVSASSALPAVGFDFRAVHVPGGEVSSEEEMYAALGGEETVLADGFCLKTDIILDSPLIISSGSYSLKGAGCTIGRGFAEGDLIVLRSGAELCLGDEKHVGDYADITVSGNVYSEKTDDGSYIHRVEEQMFDADTVKGALIAIDGGTLRLKTGSVLQNNYSLNSGGGVRVESGEMLLEGGSILDCGTKENGGGVLVSAHAVLRMNAGTISDCYASRFGGGVYTEGKATFSAGTVAACSALQGGGVYAAAETKLEEAVLSGNRAELGGGIYFAVDMTLSGGSLVGNEAKRGGAAYNASSLEVNSLYTKGNRAENGAGLYNAGLLVLNNFYFNENEASERGGGLFNETGCTCTWNGGTFASNTAKAGGGIMNYGSLLYRGGSYLVNKADAGPSLCNIGYLTVSGSICISEVNPIMLIPGEGELQGVMQIDGKLTADVAAVIVPGKEVDGVISTDYDSKAAFLAGSAEDVADAAGRIRVKADGEQQYSLRKDGTLKKTYAIFLRWQTWTWIGGTVVLVCVLVGLLIWKRKRSTAS